MNDNATQAESVREILEHVVHLLPAQAPLHSFVHHNTLHALEDMHFEEAVLEGMRIFGTEPYQKESAFAEHLERGRILLRDVDGVLEEEARRDKSFEAPVLAGFTRRAFRTRRLQTLFEIPEGSALDWQLLETGLLREIHPSVDAGYARTLGVIANKQHAALPAKERVPRLLERLWEALDAASSSIELSAPPLSLRRRSQLMALGHSDIDLLVHPLMIRLSAAFLDQGVGAWSMPDRDKGFLRSARSHLSRVMPSPGHWARGLAAELRRQESAGESAEEVACRALREMGFDEASWPSVIQETLLSLRGWAGMMHQFETRPDRAPVRPVPARLVDYLAVHLTLDCVVARNALHDRLGPDATWSRLEQTIAPPSPGSRLPLVYEAFVTAQFSGVDPETLEQDGAALRWLEEVRAFDDLERRRILHLAYERRLRINLLDAIGAHARSTPLVAPSPKFQAVFCIDERECSTRRHLEESFPEVETFGAPGHFGVTMAWQGLGEARPTPLCPVHITPTHYLTERALRTDEEQEWLAARRRRGLLTHALVSSTRGTARGGIVSASVGLWSVIPMIGRCLFPRLAERWTRYVLDGGRKSPETRLMLQRNGTEKDSEGRFIGYSVSEMAVVVESQLRAMGLVRGFCEIILVVGHGSKSLNNPHESAHDCGATGGGRGGPNARAFAAMANHPDVRGILRKKDIVIPDDTWFVATYHNTCDDAAEFYDQDLMPDARSESLEIAKTAMREACALEAHERCRRFRSAPRTNDSVTSLRHVEGRAVDLAQPRPEYGHATNCYAIIGRRRRTRGLFMDRRAFLVSYDPTTDSSGELLEEILGAAVPVGAGINLEYYFSFVDPTGYGCGTKLPHNITGLIGVMDGHASDLRTGLPWQMVEIHEPVRLLTVVEASTEVLAGILDRNPSMKDFLDKGWIHVVALDPETDRIDEYVDGRFRRYRPESRILPAVSTSAQFYSGESDHLGFARIVGGLASSTSAGRTA